MIAGPAVPLHPAAGEVFGVGVEHREKVMKRRKLRKLLM